MSSAHSIQTLEQPLLRLRRMPRLTRQAPVFAVIFACALMLLSASPMAQTRDLFTIRNVPIEANSESSNVARTTALADGQRRAWRLLVQRLGLRADVERAPRPDEALLSSVVQGVEIADERASSTRYLARLTVQFRADRVRAVLTQAGISYSETFSKPSLLLPVLETGAGKFLFEGPPHWRDALRSTDRDGLVPLILPAADDADAQALNAEALFGANAAAALRPLLTKYRLNDALVAHAVVLPAADGGTQLAIALFAIGSAGPRDLPEGLAFPLSGDGAESVRVAARDTIAAIEETWKRETRLSLDKPGELSVTVPLRGLPQWVSVRNRLAEVPTMRQADLLSISSKDAQVRLSFFGEPAQLALALAQKDLNLIRNQDGFWTLTSRR